MSGAGSLARTMLSRLRERARWFVRVPSAEARIAEIEERLDATQHKVEHLTDSESPLAASLHSALAQATQANETAHEALALGHEANHALARSRLTFEDLGRLSLIHQTTLWLDRITVPEDLTISVIIATRDRAELLPDAIESVLAQSYTKLELVVIDDGSTDATPDVLDAVSDSRLTRLRSAGVGACAARNVGLDAAAGEVIAYLDDDNLMHENWLKGVAWAMSERPDVEVLYGARVIDDYERVHDRDGRGLPWVQFARFDREALEHGNTTDMGVLAHRADIPGARFDPTLNQFGDWDLFLKLVEDRDPLELPIIAGHYTTDAPNRLSESPTADADTRHVQERLAARRAEAAGRSRDGS